MYSITQNNLCTFKYGYKYRKATYVGWDDKENTLRMVNSESKSSKFAQDTSLSLELSHFARVADF